MKKVTVFLISVLAFVCFTVPVNAFGDTADEIAAADGFIAEKSAEALLTVNTSAALNISAKSYLLMDRNTGTVLLAGNEHARLYPASVTKIMSMLLISEAL